MTQQLRRALGKQDSFLNEIEAQAVAHDGRDLLLQRLLAGSRWLTAARSAWAEDRPDAPTDARFSAALAAWDVLERKLRHQFCYEGCVYGPGQRCPEDAPVTCDACIVIAKGSQTQ